MGFAFIQAVLTWGSPRGILEGRRAWQVERREVKKSGEGGEEATILWCRYGLCTGPHSRTPLRPHVSLAQHVDPGDTCPPFFFVCIYIYIYHTNAPVYKGISLCMIHAPREKRPKLCGQRNIGERAELCLEDKYAVVSWEKEVKQGWEERETKQHIYVLMYVHVNEKAHKGEVFFFFFWITEEKQGTRKRLFVDPLSAKIVYIMYSRILLLKFIYFFLDLFIYFFFYIICTYSNQYFIT